METKKRLKLIFTGYTGTPSFEDTEEGRIPVVDPASGKVVTEWSEKTTTYTLTIDEDLVKDIFVPNADGKISAVAYEKLYSAANGIIADSIMNMNGIIPCFKNTDFTSYFARFLLGGVTHLTTVEAVWEVVNVQPIESL